MKDSDEKNQETDACSATLATVLLHRKPGRGGGCGKAKKRYESARAARSQLLKYAAKEKTPFGSWYWCKYCTSYHVTSKPADGKFRQL